ncbi:MAG: GNAT family N-acetyltransferase, partial [Planctomycetota bacterium]
MTTDPADIQFRAAEISDVQPIAEMLQPYVLQRKLLRRTHAELAELVRHAFVAIQAETGTNTADTNSLSTTDQYIRIVGFCAVEVYSSKLAEIQSLAVANGYQGTGIGKQLVQLCVERARSLGVMEVMAIS